MKWSVKSFTVFIVLGLFVGYCCHRIALTYNSLSSLSQVERLLETLNRFDKDIAHQPFVFTFTADSTLAFFLGVCATLLAYLWFISSKRNLRLGEEHGSAHWGKWREARPFMNRKNPDDNIIYSQKIRLALTEKKSPKYDRNKNLIVIGGSGAGKTFRFVKPNLIQGATSYIVVDPKDHLAETTGLLMEEMGYQIKFFDLVNMQHCDGFNPFRYVETENDLNRLLTTYFNNTKGDGSKTDPFWDESSMTFTRALASYLVDFYNPPMTLEEQENFKRLSASEQEKLLAKRQEMAARRKAKGIYPNFTEISQLIKQAAKVEGQEKSVLDILFEDYEQLYGSENFTMRNWADFQNYKDRTLDSVIAVTTAKFSFFNIQSVSELTKIDTLDITSWGETKTIVYLVLPDNDTTFNFLSALLFSTAFNTLSRYADTVCNGSLPIHVRAVMDEFANTGIIPNFAEFMATLRSRNMSIAAILQTISQMQGLYKERDAWKTIIGNCDSLLYLGGNEEETWKFMSGYLGKETVDTYHFTRNYGSQTSGSKQDAKIARDLMTPDEIGRMSREDCIVRLANMPPFRDKKYNPIKQHSRWKRLATGPDDIRWWSYQGYQHRQDLRQRLNDKEEKTERFNPQERQIVYIKAA